MDVVKEKQCWQTGCLESEGYGLLWGAQCVFVQGHKQRPALLVWPPMHAHEVGFLHCVPHSTSHTVVKAMWWVSRPGSMRKRRLCILLISGWFWWCHQGVSGTDGDILQLSWRFVTVLGFCGLSWRRTCSAGACQEACWFHKAWAAAGPISTPGSLEDWGRSLQPSMPSSLGSEGRHL